MQRVARMASALSAVNLYEGAKHTLRIPWKPPTRRRISTSFTNAYVRVCFEQLSPQSDCWQPGTESQHCSG
eukprot:CAMPEP_0196744416 /NCGR_PEP_ID=MMETSP1091-20130531/57467_1 /TAXON_ID=302021 /ORGANISM="Rhodomonas sp., Strain CCMP768" /LENGTH=70 /DNA_ID=CAMNT_0042090961 /DNA_START=119 /DNA_END=331 /DNA_ORIENTATION=-